MGGVFFKIKTEPNSTEEKFQFSPLKKTITSNFVILWFCYIRLLKQNLFYSTSRVENQSKSKHCHENSTYPTATIKPNYIGCAVRIINQVTPENTQRFKKFNTTSILHIGIGYVLATDFIPLTRIQIYFISTKSRDIKN